MRDVLFKGKMLHNNEWVEGGLVQRDGRAYIVGVSKKLMIDGIEVDPETVCQLIQTDEVRVWENDIIQFEDDDEVVSVIRYSYESAKFVFDNYGIKGCLMEYGWDETAGGFGYIDSNEFNDFYTFDFKVIGNVFDNPELIYKR